MRAVCLAAIAFLAFAASPAMADDKVKVIIAFDPEVKSVPSLADLKEEEKAYFLELLDDAGLVRISFGKGVLESSYTIDGQHRLKGMSELAFNVEVPVSLFLSAPPLERAFQFITINNKANKVPTDNIKACIANFDAILAPGQRAAAV